MLTAFRLQEKGGPLETDTTYTIGGPEIEATMMKNKYMDTVTWEANKLRVRRLKLPDKQEELIYERRLTPDGNAINMRCTFIDLQGKKTSPAGITTEVVFEKKGNSPNVPPPSVGVSGEETDGKGSGDVSKNSSSSSSSGIGSIRKMDLSGVWVRNKTHNMEAVLGAAGAGYIQRSLGAKMAMTHTITMDHPELSAFRLQERGGPINTDSTDMTIEGDWIEVLVMKEKMRQRVYWVQEHSGAATDALVMQRQPVTKGEVPYEMVMTRTLEQAGSGYELTLKIVHRDLVTKVETEGLSWFSNSSPSPNPPPIATTPVLQKQQRNGERSRTDSVDDIEKTDYEDDDDDNDDDAVLKMRRKEYILNAKEMKKSRSSGKL